MLNLFIRFVRYNDLWIAARGISRPILFNDCQVHLFWCNEIKKYFFNYIRNALFSINLYEMIFTMIFRCNYFEIALGTDSNYRECLILKIEKPHSEIALL